MDLNTILSSTVKTLKEHLTDLGLAINGNKIELQNRLREYYGFIDNTDGIEVESDSEIEYNDAASKQSKVVERTERSQRSIFTLRDIEDSLTPFSGDGYPDVRQWVEEFEDNAVTVRWDNLQKFVYAKQLLKGAAKAFVRSKAGIKNWISLKTSLISEFGSKLSAIEVHRLLSKRQKKYDESYREYLYSLMEIGNPINLDDESLIEYFINGIPDSKQNKAVLYQATSVEELKKQLKVYEKVRGNPKMSPNIYRKPVKSESKTENNTFQNAVQKKCFKCGDLGHLSSSCSLKQIKCFKCNGVGHKSFECKMSNIKKEKRDVNVLYKDSDGNVFVDSEWSYRMFRNLEINNKNYFAFIDSGSDISIIRYDSFKKMNNVSLVKDKQELFGLGNTKIHTHGYVMVNVLIDDLSFEVKLHVMNYKDIKYPLLLGNDIFRKVDFVTKNGKITFMKKSIERIPKKSEIEDLFNNFKQICLASDDEFLNTKDKFCVDHWNNQVRQTVDTLIKEYSPQRPEVSPVSMKLILSDEIPVYHRPRRLSIAEQGEVESKVNDWLEEGIIRQSFSEYSSPIVLVTKKDGTKRMCCDFRKLNKKIIRDNFPMMVIDDVLQRLKGGKIFTTLDLRNGFFHVPVEESSKKYTSFVTHNGQFEFNYVPFGISNSPAVFTRFMGEVSISTN